MSMIKWRSRKDVREERLEEHPMPVMTEDAEIESPEEKAQYEQCGRCINSYLWKELSGKDRLICRILREPVLDLMKAGVRPCGMFEEHLGCMHCEHRVSDPVTLINGEELVKCERLRVTFTGREGTTIEWERVNKGRKCVCYHRKGDEE